MLSSERSSKPNPERLSATARATVVAAAVALSLVLVKLTVGIGSGAMVLIASAVDSGLDFLVSLFNHFAVRSAEKPSDHRFNYGFGKIEALASFVEGLVIALSSVVIVFSAVLKIQRGDQLSHPTIAIVVTVFSTLVTGALVIYLRRVAKRADSLVLRADALHYKMDLFTNLAILVALVIVAQTGWFLIDPLLSIGIAVYIFITSLKLIREGLDMLLDHSLPLDLLERIEQAIVSTSPSINSFHQLKTRRSAQTNFVEVHLVFNRQISLFEAHRISDEVEHRIESLEQTRWVINCHLDPLDDSRSDARSAL